MSGYIVLVSVSAPTPVVPVIAAFESATNVNLNAQLLAPCYAMQERLRNPLNMCGCEVLHTPNGANVIRFSPKHDIHGALRNCLFTHIIC